MPLSKKEAGRLGGLKTQELYIEKYNNNPKKCKGCGVTLNYTQRKNKYCSQSCSATFNNRKRKKERRCLNCNSVISSKKFCDNQNFCFHEYYHNKRLNEWKNGGNANTRTTIKRYLLSINDCCWVCGIRDWNGKPIVLELEHKDGNPDNNREENLELICPNCHSQTETYKGKNSGNGRHYRRERYKQGKSY